MDSITPLTGMEPRLSNMLPMRRWRTGEVFATLRSQESDNALRLGAEVRIASTATLPYNVLALSPSDTAETANEFGARIPMS